MALTLHGRRYDTGEPVRITTDGDRISSVSPVTPSGSISDWPWIAPGLVDLQINGHGGIWFSNAELTPEEVVKTVQPLFASGITRVLPTLVTASHQALSNGFSAIRQACEATSWVDRMIAGCHLEGPFISGEDGPRGAHPLAHVRPADWDEFQKLQESAGGRILLVTLAAESEGAPDFIRRAVDSGVTVAIGHTAANSAQIQAAVDAGARLSTHLGNGAHGQIRRHPNYIWDQLGDARLTASIITDSHHLPPSVIRSIIRTKTPSGTVITCDAAGLAGCPPGEYEAASGNVEILKDGRIVIAGQQQLLAGSSLLTDVCVAHAIAVGGVSLSEAFDMAGRNPCRLLGIEVTRLSRGSRADLVQFDFDRPGDSIHWRSTVMGGAVFSGDVATPV